MFAVYVSWAMIPALGSNVRRHKRRIAAGLAIFFLALLCATQDPSENRDKGVYLESIRAIVSDNTPLMEPGFFVLAKVLSFVSTGAVLDFLFFFATAALTIRLKLPLFERYGGSMFGCLAAWLSYFFLLQEMTEIRVGLGIALLYLSWFSYYEHDVKKFWLYGLASMLFHYSCGLFIVAPLLFSQALSIKWKIAVLVLVAANLYNAVSDHVATDVLNELADLTGVDKFRVYSDLLENGFFAQISVVRIIPHALLLAVYILNYSKWRRDRITRYLCQIYFFGMLLFGALSSVPVLAYRVSDLFLFANIFLVGRLRKFLRPISFVPFVVLYSATFLYYMIVILKIFNPFTQV